MSRFYRRRPMQVLSPARLIVTYLSTRDSAWRCLFYTLTHRWQSILIAVAPAVVIPTLYYLKDVESGADRRYQHFIAIPPIYFCIYAVVLWLNVRSRFPKAGPPRIFTSSFHDEGFQDVGPGSNRFVPWSSIKSVRLHRGDIHVWYGFSGACYIPANAFPDGTAARTFCESALTLWHERRSLPGLSQ
jgi:hypothetical protein